MAFFTEMRRDVQEIFRQTPHEKQVMMFSATLSKDIRPVCKKFMQDVIPPLQPLFDQCNHWQFPICPHLKNPLKRYNPVVVS